MAELTMTHDIITTTERTGVGEGRDGPAIHGKIGCADESGNRRFGNKVLSTLPQDAVDHLVPELERIDLPMRLPLEAPGEPIEAVIFPESGIISVVAIGRNGRLVEVGIVGCEGMTGSAVVMGSDRSPNQTIVQVAGQGWRIRADALRRLMDGFPVLAHHFQRAAYVFGVQTAHTALANSKGKVEQRLARWLLMAHDRLLSNESLHLTHDFLSITLGVRRPGVTDALANLEGKGLIRSRRVNITILDRAGLECAADSLYGIPEQEHARLFGGAPVSAPGL